MTGLNFLGKYQMGSKPINPLAQRSPIPAHVHPHFTQRQMKTWMNSSAATFHKQLVQKPERRVRRKVTCHQQTNPKTYLSTKRNNNKKKRKKYITILSDKL